MSTASAARPEWIYWRLEGFGSDHVGAAMDGTLVRAISPAVEALIARAWINCFFFLRYHEGGPHLRLRFSLRGGAQPQDLAAVLNEMLKTECELRLVERVYEPEVQKYGGIEAIIYAERHFFASSRLALHAIERTPHQMALRWFIAVGCFCAMLGAAGLDIAGRQRLLEQYSSYWRDMYKELTGWTVPRNPLDSDAADLLTQIVAADGELPQPLVDVISWARWLGAMHRDVAALRDLAERGRLEAPLERVISSLAHTFHNRLGLSVVDEVLIADWLGEAFALRNST
jgi:thiopeptide-type bacteriocin biosynthesis protein